MTVPMENTEVTGLRAFQPALKPAPIFAAMTSSRNLGSKHRAGGEAGQR